MKKRLLMLLTAFLAVANVGWLAAQESVGETTATISSDVTVALKGKPMVFGISTKKGNAADNTMVRVKLVAENAAFDSWTSYYYEPNGDKSGWIEWNPENDGFGPSAGSPLMDATSYIKVIPNEAGTFTYTLNVYKVEGETNVTATESPYISQVCTLEVKESLDETPLAIIGKGTESETYYSSLPNALLFAQQNDIVSLTGGTYELVSQLVIDKPLTIEGVVDENTGEPATVIKATESDWAANLENSQKNLVSIHNPNYCCPVKLSSVSKAVIFIIYAPHFSPISE